MAPQRATAIEDFWSRVDKTGECWVWLGCYNGAGYGAVRWNGKTDRAHRVAWAITNGPIPEGQLILHRCDNRPCVRPDHLFLGDRAANAHDRDAKGRTAKAGAILTKESVSEIRRRHPQGDSARSLASEFGVSQWAIFDLLSHRTWK